VAAQDFEDVGEPKRGGHRAELDAVHESLRDFQALGSCGEGMF